MGRGARVGRGLGVPSVWVLELESVWPWGLVFQLLSELDLDWQSVWVSESACQPVRRSDPLPHAEPN